MSKLIFGCGYLGSRVAGEGLAAGEQVFAVTRSDRRAASLAEQGLSPIVADITQPSSLVDLPIVETVLLAVGFDRLAGMTMHEVYVSGLCNVLDALPAETGRVIYISSTGVYGQTDGQWVDEQSECRPTREGGRACLAAEQALWEHPLGARAVVLRLAGIYGPGRLPQLDHILEGQPISAPGDGYLNLIHVSDAVRAVLAAQQRAELGQIYLVSDGQPATRREFLVEMARLLDAPDPRFLDSPEREKGSGVFDANDPQGRPGKRLPTPFPERATGSKRVRNRRMLRELGIEPDYPSFREGLAAIVAARP